MKKKVKTERTIGEHVSEPMKYSKRDLAVMYANLSWCFNEITKDYTMVKRKKP